MKSNMIGARIPIVGRSIAARRRTASLWSCSRRESRMSSLSARRPPARSTPRSTPAASSWYVRVAARLRRELRRPPERGRLTHPASDPRQHLAELAHRRAVAAAGQALHRLHRARPGAHVHREQMVNGIELHSDPRRAIGHLAFEPPPRSGQADDETGHAGQKRRQRSPQQDRDRRRAHQADHHRLAELANSVLVGRPLGVPRLA